MTATRVSIDELRRPKRSPLVGMGVHLALLQDSLDSFRNCWEEFMASPFGDVQTAEDAEEYRHDEDNPA